MVSETSTSVEGTPTSACESEPDAPTVHELSEALQLIARDCDALNAEEIREIALEALKVQR